MIPIQATAKEYSFFRSFRFLCLVHLLSFSKLPCQAFHPRAHSHVTVRQSAKSANLKKHTSLFVASTAFDFDFSETLTTMKPTTQNSWEDHFRNLERFRREFGHVNVPQNPSDEIQQRYPHLAHFCKNQRSLYNHHDTTSSPFLQERKARLESLGFKFDIRKCLWDVKYDKLSAFWKEHGHLPSKSENQELYAWMYYQRQKYKSSKVYKPLTQDQVKRLERINFCWNPKEEEWWHNYYVLKKHREQHGNWKVADSKLRTWKNSLRRTCREYVLAVCLEGSMDDVHVSGLNAKRLEALREIAFCWLPEPSGPLKEDPPEDIFEGYE